MKITKRKAVTINYTLTNDDGEVLDTSRGGEPLSFIFGIGTLIPGLENALDGKSPGDHLKVSIKPEDAYGPRDESLIRLVPRAAFGGVEELEVGMCFQATSDQGDQMIMITRIDGDNITVDGNHPLAGMPLNFDVEVVAVRDATDEEISHGHVHGPGGHHH